MSAPPTLRVVPLGGLGHIGGNMMVFETEEDLVVVDCGVLFPSLDQPGIDYLIPDVSYLRERRHKLRGLVLTHGHEDHLGAVPFVGSEVAAPVFGTRWTLALLRAKMAEHPGLDYSLHEIRAGESFQLGALKITPIHVCHSIPDAVALAIDTPVGPILHTGDFNLDAQPLDDRPTDEARFRQLGDHGLTALFSDSTNAERSGQIWGERRVRDRLFQLIEQASQRVFVTMFASNIHRLQSIIDGSLAVGRKVLPLGRSVEQNIRLALEHGYLRAAPRVLVTQKDIRDIPARQLTVVASGSQGEPRSALARLAAGRHGQVEVTPGDTVIISARRIPGNERSVDRMINQLFRRGAQVIDDRVMTIHTSGHAFRDEQQRMLTLCRPHFFVPIHGEYRHLVRHVALAIESGVAPQNTTVLDNGEGIEFRRTANGIDMRRTEPVTAGHHLVRGGGVNQIDDTAIRARREMSGAGVVFCAVLLAEDGSLVGSPQLVMHGVVNAELSDELARRASEVLRHHLEKTTPLRESRQPGDEIRTVLRRFFREAIGWRPLIIPAPIWL